VLELPWNTVTPDTVDLSQAQKILDRDHFGLEKVKERIIEYLAVEKLTANNKSQILCLVGPPGVGKTSIAFSVAKALGRKMSRLSLGGIRDEADIRGHRKTYVGAMPGRIISAVRLAGSRNALILLDEVDKLGNDYRGDAASALLEVLDPEQNAAFRDHYIELPFDLSDVMFITTANTTSTIPRPLLDRMEVIELTSYTDEEKLQIAKRHLLPKQLNKHGLDKKQLKLSDNILREIISCYTKESGVRNLERELAAVCRKAAKLITMDGAAAVKVTAKNIETLLGPRRFKPEHKRKNDEIGVVCGLAWTSVGGELLETEVNAVDGTGSLEITGNLGSVMKESVHAAITYIRSRASEFGINPRFHREMDIHIHFPEGAIPKDGPSAGITIATAIVSALAGAPVRRDIAMTGEITLRGRVLPIGGLKEKTMAAYRSGITTVIIPSDNESDLLDIDPTVRGALNFILADSADKVIKTAVDFSRRTVPVWEPAKDTAPDPERQVMPPLPELKHRGQAVIQ
jgi:ATP-dependent Lon protease